MSFEKCPVCATPVSALDAKCPKCKAILIKEKTESHVNKELDASNTKQQELYEEVKKQNGKQTASKPTFGDAIRTCFSKYATFRGRARRSEFWYWLLFTLIISGCLELISEIFYWAEDEIAYTCWNVISSIWSWGILLPSLAVWIRRLHDIGKGGWAIVFHVFLFIVGCGFIGVAIAKHTFKVNLLTLLPFFIIVYDLTRDSKRHENKYGKSPKYQDENIGL